MTNPHPITPPPELVQQWINEEDGLTAGHIATQAAQWGADQELQACINFVYDNELCDPDFYNNLRAYRRPKPPSLKEQALESVKRFELGQDELSDLAVIRRALETLDD
jgi:hypothetical protein